MKSLGLLTVSQAADYLNMPRPTLYQHLRERRIEGIQIGGRWRIELSALESFIHSEGTNTRTSAPAPGTIGKMNRIDSEELRSAGSLDDLAQENLRLRRIIADQILEIHRLKSEIKPFDTPRMTQDDKFDQDSGSSSQ